MELLVGSKAEFSKTISESDIYLFAGITGDLNPVHINSEEAKKGFARQRIAHGALINGLISAVIGMQLPGPGTIYMEQDSKFIKPVYIGDTIKAVVEIKEILNIQKRILGLSTIAYNQNGDEVIIGYAKVKAPEK